MIIMIGCSLPFLLLDKLLLRPIIMSHLIRPDRRSCW